MGSFIYDALRRVVPGGRSSPPAPGATSIHGIAARAAKGAAVDAAKTAAGAISAPISERLIAVLREVARNDAYNFTPEEKAIVLRWANDAEDGHSEALARLDKAMGLPGAPTPMASVDDVLQNILPADVLDALKGSGPRAGASIQKTAGGRPDEALQVVRRMLARSRLGGDATAEAIRRESEKGLPASPPPLADSGPSSIEFQQTRWEQELGGNEPSGTRPTSGTLGSAVGDSKTGRPKRPAMPPRDIGTADAGPEKSVTLAEANRRRAIAAAAGRSGDGAVQDEADLEGLTPQQKAAARRSAAAGNTSRTTEFDRLQADIDRLDQQARQVSESIGKAGPTERDALKAEERRLREEIASLKERKAGVVVSAASGADELTEQQIYEAAIRDANAAAERRRAATIQGNDPRAAISDRVARIAEGRESARAIGAQSSRLGLRTRLVRLFEKSRSAKTAPFGSASDAEVMLPDRTQMLNYSPSQLADIGERFVRAGVKESDVVAATSELLETIRKTKTFRDPAGIADPSEARVLRPPGADRLYPSATQAVTGTAPDPQSVPVSPMATAEDVGSDFDKIVARFGGQPPVPTQADLNRELQAGLQLRDAPEGPAGNKPVPMGSRKSPAAAGDASASEEAFRFLERKLAEAEARGDSAEAERYRKLLSDPGRDEANQYAADFLSAYKKLLARNNSSISSKVQSKGPMDRHVAAVSAAMDSEELSSGASELRMRIIAAMKHQSGGSYDASGAAADRALQKLTAKKGKLAPALEELAQRLDTEPTLQAVSEKVAGDFGRALESTMPQFAPKAESLPVVDPSGREYKVDNPYISLGYDPKSRPIEDFVREQDGTIKLFPKLDKNGQPIRVPKGSVSATPTQGANAQSPGGLRSLISDIRRGFAESSVPEETAGPQAGPAGAKPGDVVMEPRRRVYMTRGDSADYDASLSPIILTQHGSNSQGKRLKEAQRFFLPMQDGRFAEYGVEGFVGVAEADDFQRMLNEGWTVGRLGAPAPFKQRPLSMSPLQVARTLFEYSRSGGNAQDAFRALAAIEDLKSPSAPTGTYQRFIEELGGERGAADIISSVEERVGRIRDASGARYGEVGASAFGPPQAKPSIGLPLLAFEDTRPGRQVEERMREFADSNPSATSEELRAERAAIERDVLFSAFNASPADLADPAKAARNVINRVEAAGLPMSDSFLVHQLAAFADVADDTIRPPADDLDRLKYAVQVEASYRQATPEQLERVIMASPAGRKWHIAATKDGGVGRFAGEATGSDYNTERAAMSPEEAAAARKSDGSLEEMATAGAARMETADSRQGRLAGPVSGGLRKQTLIGPDRPRAKIQRDAWASTVAEIFPQTVRVDVGGGATESRRARAPLGFRFAESRPRDRAPSFGEMSDPAEIRNALESELKSVEGLIDESLPQLDPRAAKRIAGDAAETIFPLSSNAQRAAIEAAVMAGKKGRRMTRAEARRKLMASAKKAGIEAVRRERVALAERMRNQGRQEILGEDGQIVGETADEMNPELARLMDRRDELKAQITLQEKAASKMTSQSDGRAMLTQANAQDSYLRRLLGDSNTTSGQLAEIIEGLFGTEHFSAADNVRTMAGRLHEKGLLSSPSDYESVIYEALAHTGYVKDSATEQGARAAAQRVASELGLKAPEPAAATPAAPAAPTPQGPQRIGALARIAAAGRRALFGSPAEPAAPRAVDYAAIADRLGIPEDLPAEERIARARSLFGESADAAGARPAIVSDDFDPRSLETPALPGIEQFEAQIPDESAIRAMSPADAAREKVRLTEMANSLARQMGSRSDLEMSAAERLPELVRRLREEVIPSIGRYQDKLPPAPVAMRKPPPAVAGEQSQALPRRPGSPPADSLFSPLVRPEDEFPGLPDDIAEQLSGGARLYFGDEASVRDLVEAHRGNVYEASKRRANLDALAKADSDMQSVMAEVEDLKKSTQVDAGPRLEAAQKEVSRLASLRDALARRADASVMPAAPFDPASDLKITDAAEPGRSTFSASRPYASAAAGMDIPAYRAAAEKLESIRAQMREAWTSDDPSYLELRDAEVAAQQELAAASRALDARARLRANYSSTMPFMTESDGFDGIPSSLDRAVLVRPVVDGDGNVVRHEIVGAYRGSASEVAAILDERNASRMDDALEAAEAARQAGAARPSRQGAVERFDRAVQRLGSQAGDSAPPRPAPAPVAPAAASPGARQRTAAPAQPAPAARPPRAASAPESFSGRFEEDMPLPERRQPRASPVNTIRDLVYRNRGKLGALGGAYLASQYGDFGDSARGGWLAEPEYDAMADLRSMPAAPPAPQGVAGDTNTVEPAGALEPGAEGQVAEAAVPPGVRAAAALEALAAARHARDPQYARPNAPYMTAHNLMPF